MSASAGPVRQSAVAAAARLMPEALGPSLLRRVRRRLAWAGFVAVVIAGLWHTGFFDLPRLVQGVEKLMWLLPFLFPPAHGGWLDQLLRSMAETLAMAFLGTLLATLAAVPLGFLGARNVVVGALTHFSLRRVFDGLRGIDSLIWALVFVNVVGLGPFAGILAIAASDAGSLAKLFAEAIENVDRGPVEGVRAAGGSRLHEIRFAIVPQVLPVMLSNVLYFLESNTRSATILGIVGAGGIGLELSDRIRVNDWDQVSFIIILILIAVYAIDTLSAWLRHHVAGSAERG